MAPRGLERTLLWNEPNAMESNQDNQAVAIPFVGSDLRDEDFESIRRLLLERCGLDLASYKDQCIRRRIAGRIRALGYATFAPYLEWLRTDAREAETLLAALSIHVSQFFRNPSTFRALEERYLPELIERACRSGERKLTLWSAGCAGGEEAYSLALLLADLAPADFAARVLATDISPVALERARRGEFDGGRLAEVPSAVRQRWFQASGNQFRLDDSIRERVEFACHDLLAANPYPRADLILCRNVLIYFSREEQEVILQRFADALPPAGILVLGKTETLLGESRRLFQIEQPEERICRRTTAT